MMLLLVLLGERVGAVMPLAPLHVLFPDYVVPLATGPTGVAREKGRGILRSEHQAGYRRSIAPNHFNIPVKDSK